MEFDINKKRFAFNAPNLGSLIILSEIANNLEYDFIIQISPKLIEFYGIETINGVLRKNKGNIWFSLDHCKNIEMIKQCKKEDGWTSTLFDLSAKSFKENIRLSKNPKIKAN